MKTAVRLGTIEDFRQAVLEVIADPTKAEDQPEHTLFIPPEFVPKIFSEERVRIIREIRNHEYNINDLSKRLGRKRENVSRDLRILKEYGIVDFKKNGREKNPIIVKDELVIKI